eukprot:scaffold270349_cov24-Tisochrysis_lutea.AAC.1
MPHHVVELSPLRQFRRGGTPQQPLRPRRFSRPKAKPVQNLGRAIEEEGCLQCPPGIPRLRRQLHLWLCATVR